MALTLWQAVTEALDAALGASDAAKATAETGPRRPLAVAGAGFMAILAVGRLFHSPETMACAVLPPAFVAMWGARRAWLHPGNRKPALAAALVLAALAAILYALPFLAPEDQWPPSLGSDLILASVIAALLATVLAAVAYLRREWRGF
jgi:peptidoglycan/LPS O-acetylase OafA/YrhL